ncbi:MAG: D-alanyl-D-alanine carboxypeptidase family protein [Ruminococcus sp.]|nr:D-alanyl-D-alanine carboxypeptidase family protein [Ruminococcus sp.]
MYVKKNISILLAVVILLLSLPMNVGAVSDDEITAPSAILVDGENFNILYEKNSHEKRSVASITKVMTVLLIMEDIESGKISLTDTVTASAHAASMGGSDIWLEEGEQMSLDDMLKATLVASANDAAVALAEYTEGSEDAFVKRMNTRAKELGMKDTVFKNCNGLDEEGHISSAYDVALMSAELIKYTKVFDYTSIWLDFLRDGKTQIVNTNKLLKSYNGITGLKTGTTDDAGSCISATAKRDGLSLIAVVLGSDSGTDRFKDASILLDYGFNNYSVIIPKEKKLPKVKVNKGMESEVEVYSNPPESVLVAKGSDSEIIVKLDLPKKIDAPVEKDKKIGEITYSINDKVVQKADIRCKNSVEECSFGNSFRYLLSQLISL